MNTDQISAVVIRGVIPVLLGLYISLLAFRVIGRKPGENQKWDEWRRRYGWLLKVCGAAGVLSGLFLMAQVLFFAPNPGPKPSGAWARAYTDDRRFSAEFPEPPQRDTETVQTVEFHTLTLPVNARNNTFTLDYSDLPEHLRGVDDEGVLDATRDAVLEFGGQPGKGSKLVREEKHSGPGPPGRFLLISTGRFTQWMKVFIVGGRSYRAIAVTPRNPQDEADGQRFVDSVRFEEADK